MTNEKIIEKAIAALESAVEEYNLGYNETNCDYPSLRNKYARLKREALNSIQELRSIKAGEPKC